MTTTTVTQGCSECLDWFDNPMNAGRVTAENPVCPIMAEICVRFPDAVAPPAALRPSPLDKAIVAMRTLAASMGFPEEATEKGLKAFEAGWRSWQETKQNQPQIIYGVGRVSDPAVAAAVRALEEKAHALRLGRRWTVAGIAVGGCVDAIGTGRQGAMRRQGHAHTAAKVTNRGWVCIKSRRPARVLTPSGRPTALLIHEVAHVVTMAGHDAHWRRMVAALGAPAEARGYAQVRS